MDLNSKCRLLTATALTLTLTLSTTRITRADENCVIPYSEFEAIKPHFDLDACPAGLASEDDGFCRISLENGGATLYEFHYSGDDACLTAVRPARDEEYLKRR
jgi:hypothetical protein